MTTAFFIKQTSGLWNKVACENALVKSHPALDLHKNLPGLFQAGDFFYTIFNPKKFAFDFISPQVETILGYSPSDVTLPMLIENIHPEDRSWVFEFENLATNFLSKLPAGKLTKYKIRYDFRIKNKSGEYMRLQHQGVVIEHDDRGGIGRILIIQSDISHLKKEGIPVLAFIGLGGEPSYLNAGEKCRQQDKNKALTGREKEILKLLIDGRLSKEISDLLSISKHTVDTHRKNMIRRNNLSNTGELIGKAVTQGWL
ncbi:LuxR C-terminal-related transcriptional regulator [Mucilaginibacter sp. L3T2-6]|uniref:LuxR C-terminal-related transcriptional regulator n=1 Tax=Mucilaginibacter sp. L3T2-6 TaxID=3062491 RepID=UPI002675CD9B|nr:LuxR C-terminal-related transcriptional regulator [Mucilaginibacter sp. L3T2-6]MDO3641829.1 LuxR C-terminal-related transcriptional regulator [Mucilaginibacter sp. L3T2-6]MDV6214493.1 LuxR C-terminal-related transcriptional regulator [Mucilaginibacter sp. L3T2-6]